MAEVTETVPAKPLQPIHKDQGRFVRKRPGRGKPLAEEEKPAGPGETEGAARPSEHIDTFA